MTLRLSPAAVERMGELAAKRGVSRAELLDRLLLAPSLDALSIAVMNGRKP